MIKGDLCAVDIGGTGSRVRIIAADGRRAEVAGPRLRVDAGGADVAGLFAALDGPVRAAMDGLGLQDVDAAAAGQTGLLMLGERSREVHEGLGRICGARATAVASDALTSLIGAIGLRAGAVVATGTGCIGFGTDLAGIWNRVDGWGHVLGDDGGGSWIGKKGLQAALRAHDGRPNGSQTLRARMLERFGRPDELTAALYSAGDRAGMLASFAPDVAGAARAGDAEATQIWEETGIRLARCAAAALRGVDPVVAFTGGVTGSSDLYAGALAAELAVRAPDARMVDPAGTALDGAATVAAALADSISGGPARLPDRQPFISTFSLPQ